MFIQCNNCGSGKDLYFFVDLFVDGVECIKIKKYDRHTQSTETSKMECPSCSSKDVVLRP